MGRETTNPEGKTSMHQRQLGKDGPMVGAVGLGCMSFAGVYGGTDQETANRILAAALDMGVTHLDTSNVYGMGMSETMMAPFLRDHPNRLSIATKGGIVPGPPRRFDNTEAHLRGELEGSLNRLGVEHVDLYYIHRRQQDIPIEDVVGTLVKFIDEGKIGGFGFSEIAPSSLRLAAAVHPVRAVQSEYSLWTRLPELGMLQACAELGTAFVPFSPVARGMFGDGLLDVASFGEKDFRRNNPRFVEPNLSANLGYFARFNDFAKSQDIAPATMAIAWLLQQGDHIIPIPGTRSLKHLEQNAAAADIALSNAQLTEIDRIMPPGFAHGARYDSDQNIGPEHYC
jgi:aryl-alcohol dehydrogenase-like predicted oxidoreductase